MNEDTRCNKIHDTTEIVDLLKSYKLYEQQFLAERYAQTFFCDSYDTFYAINREECQRKMTYIRALIAGIAPSSMATLLNLHYVNGVPMEKCAECMGLSKSSIYRLLPRAHTALYNYYQRTKGEQHEKT